MPLFLFDCHEFGIGDFYVVPQVPPADTCPSPGPAPSLTAIRPHHRCRLASWIARQTPSLIPAPHLHTHTPQWINVCYVDCHRDSSATIENTASASSSAAAGGEGEAGKSAAPHRPLLPRAVAAAAANSLDTPPSPPYAAGAAGAQCADPMTRGHRWTGLREFSGEVRLGPPGPRASSDIQARLRSSSSSSSSSSSPFTLHGKATDTFVFPVMTPSLGRSH